MIDVEKKHSSDTWLTPQDVARALGIHLKTAQKKLRLGEIKGYHFGRRWKIKESDLRAYIAEAANTDEQAE